MGRGGIVLNSSSPFNKNKHCYPRRGPEAHADSATSSPHLHESAELEQVPRGTGRSWHHDKGLPSDEQPVPSRHWWHCQLCQPGNPDKPDTPPCSTICPIHVLCLFRTAAVPFLHLGKRLGENVRVPALLSPQGSSGALPPQLDRRTPWISEAMQPDPWCLVEKYFDGATAEIR